MVPFPLLPHHPWGAMTLVRCICRLPCPGASGTVWPAKVHGSAQPREGEDTETEAFIPQHCGIWVFYGGFWLLAGDLLLQREPGLGSGLRFLSLPLRSMVGRALRCHLLRGASPSPLPTPSQAADWLNSPGLLHSGTVLCLQLSSEGHPALWLVKQAFRGIEMDPNPSVVISERMKGNYWRGDWAEVFKQF